MPRTPRLSGYPLRSLARLSRSNLGEIALKGILRAELKIGSLEGLPDSLRGGTPLDTRPLQGRGRDGRGRDGDGRGREGSAAHGDVAPEITGEAAWSGASAQYSAAYRAGTTTPKEVCLRALAAARELAGRKPTVGPLLEYADTAALEEAEAATTRYRTGKTRGPLDGVPFAVKEQTAVRGLPRCLGTSFLDRSPWAEDGTSIARLRAAGAIVIGTTPMTEYGMTPIGANANRQMPRNPHATDCVAGGSSTGSGVAVATGLVPFAIGVDGGGSVRIPAAMNGVFGLKPTWGRVSRDGDMSTGTVEHIGPLASSTLDIARVLEAMAGRDPKDPQTDLAPPVAPGWLVGALGRGVRGLVVGVEDREWRDASPQIARAGEDAIRVLEKEGARIVKVQLPLARFAAAIGYVIIGIESLGALREEWREHADDMSSDLQVSFAALQGLTALEYLDAMRLRSGLRRELQQAFADIDLLALPTTASTAVRVTDAEMATGFVDPKTLDDFCRFAFLGNLSGLPAGTAPVATDGAGLPIGFQLVGDAWDEATVIAAMAHLERIGAARPVRPKVAVDILPR
jgi:aspartyl-tRNA(Asn)/glutamyl-tRNA(Gln) amidotransferase subunit A